MYLLLAQYLHEVNRVVSFADGIVKTLLRFSVKIKCPVLDA